ncbi:hypothetical protein DSM106972_075130 [Dulcicalothrix desertica PCC 7102]|uniref:Uncharacterized protein n=1 Tax=Dulcicalothrix desertica PCC 7102 TaxID=232991 RepID=A0A433V2S3_9CYAN|nr:hypothetical protein [Dulcicalothrix desertica]RUT00385.1 hypothetical protein DSM106972_075130 [Dulcicalothrix desertica PCC 7102]TWH42491.1 hypothetical protein CAL7102_06153 [Dulcicalothrix desertica PCC 7102]
MNFLESIFGGDREVEKDYRNFVNRYEQGSPSEGYSDEEVYDRYQNVSRRLPPDLYQESAQEVFSRMSPQERMQFGRYLQQQTRASNLNFPDLNQDGIDDRFQDPRYLAQATGRIQSSQPDLLGQIFRGASGMMGGQGGNILSNPLAKGAMAGIAALALKKLMNQGNQGNYGQYGDIRPASEDPLGDPADQPYRY